MCTVVVGAVTEDVALECPVSLGKKRENLLFCVFSISEVMRCCREGLHTTSPPFELYPL